MSALSLIEFEAKVYTADSTKPGQGRVFYRTTVATTETEAYRAIDATLDDGEYIAGVVPIRTVG